LVTLPWLLLSPRATNQHHLLKEAYPMVLMDMPP